MSTQNTIKNVHIFVSEKNVCKNFSKTTTPANYTTYKSKTKFTKSSVFDNLFVTKSDEK